MTKLNSPASVWEYYCSKKGIQETLDTKKEGWIQNCISNFTPDEIQYVIDADEKVGAGVMFTTPYMRSILSNKYIENTQFKGDERQLAASLDILSQALVDSVTKVKGNELVQYAKKYIEENYGITGKKVQALKLDGSPVPGVQHEKFKNVCRAISSGEYVLLKGPAGTGKSYIAKQVAEAYNMGFYEIGSVQQDYKIFGFMAADGKTYMPTPVYNACKDAHEGKDTVLLLDELDGSFAEPLLAMNNLLSSRRATFPNGETLDFREHLFVIGTANTWGLGADDEYVGRSQLDASTLDRFAAKIAIDYSPEIENAMCPDNELLAFLRDFRKCCQETHTKQLVTVRTIRALYKIIKNNPDDDITEIIEEYLTQGMPRNVISTICNRLAGSNKYVKAVKELAERGL